MLMLESFWTVENECLKWICFYSIYIFFFLLSLNAHYYYLFDIDFFAYSIFNYSMFGLVFLIFVAVLRRRCAPLNEWHIHSHLFKRTHEDILLNPPQNLESNIEFIIHSFSKKYTMELLEWLKAAYQLVTLRSHIKTIIFFFRLSLLSTRNMCIKNHERVSLLTFLDKFYMIRKYRTNFLILSKMKKERKNKRNNIRFRLWLPFGIVVS